MAATPASSFMPVACGFSWGNAFANLPSWKQCSAVALLPPMGGSMMHMS